MNRFDGEDLVLTSEIKAMALTLYLKAKEVEKKYSVELLAQDEAKYKSKPNLTLLPGGKVNDI